jgi:hypothetical protein
MSGLACWCGNRALESGQNGRSLPETGSVSIDARGVINKDRLQRSALSTLEFYERNLEPKRKGDKRCGGKFSSLLTPPTNKAQNPPQQRPRRPQPTLTSE